MGHQESYVRINNKDDFDKLVAAFREVGKKFYEDNGAIPIEVITLTKPIKGNLKNMCAPEITYNFDTGEKFVYIVGDRHLQRSPCYLFNNKEVSGVEIYFAECFPSYNIFGIDGKTKTAIHEPFVWDV